MDEKLVKAKSLIQAKRYAEARRLLQTIDHPKAKEWLTKLPASKQSSVPVWIVVALVIVVMVISGGVGFIVGRGATSSDAPTAAGITLTELAATEIIATNQVVMTAIAATTESGD